MTNWELTYSSEVQLVIIMVGHGSTQAGMMLKKELRFLHVDLQAAEATMNHTGHNLNI